MASMVANSDAAQSEDAQSQGSQPGLDFHSEASLLTRSRFPQHLIGEDGHVQVVLTFDLLSLPAASSFLKLPSAGANVLFTGTTRNSFDGKPVSRLSYSAYPKLALNTLIKLATSIRSKHGLERVYVVHRLGEVSVGEESIIIGVSAAHRGEAWRGAEELLEVVKEKAEIWKREWFEDGSVEQGKDGERGHEVGIWRANKDVPATGRSKMIV